MTFSVSEYENAFSPIHYALMAWPLFVLYQTKREMLRPAIGNARDAERLLFSRGYSRF